MKNKKRNIIILVLTGTIILVIFMFKYMHLKEKQDKIQFKNENEGNITISLNEYNNINIGMNYSDVTKIIGGDCIKTEEETTYICSGEYVGTSATFAFENDILIDKSQIGLE